MKWTSDDTLQEQGIPAKPQIVFFPPLFIVTMVKANSKSERIFDSKCSYLWIIYNPSKTPDEKRITPEKRRACFHVNHATNWTTPSEFIVQPQL